MKAKSSEARVVARRPKSWGTILTFSAIGLSLVLATVWFVVMRPTHVDHFRFLGRHQPIEESVGRAMSGEVLDTRVYCWREESQTVIDAAKSELQESGFKLRHQSASGSVWQKLPPRASTPFASGKAPIAAKWSLEPAPVSAEVSVSAERVIKHPAVRGSKPDPAWTTVYVSTEAQDDLATKIRLLIEPKVVERQW